MLDPDGLQGGQRLRVLVVAPVPGLSEFCLGTLSASGYAPQCRFVESLFELSAELATGAWDLVLSADTSNSPTAEVAAIVRRHSPCPPLIVISREGGVDRAVEAMRNGAADYVLQGDVARLATAVKREVRDTTQGRQPSAPTAAEDNGPLRTAVKPALPGVLVHRGLHPLFANRAFANLLGYDAPAQVLAVPSVELLVHPDERKRLRARSQAQGLAATERSECRALRCDGTVVWMDCTVSTIPWSGQPAQLISVVDITERKQAEAALAASEANLPSLIELDLNALLTQMETTLRCVIGEDVVLESRLNPQLGVVTADPAQMEQIVVNLAVNARDAMPSGGTLSIETDNVEVESGLAERQRGLAAGPYVMVAMTDKGTGMTRDVRERIFDPFFTTKDMRKGTGLRLAAVYGIVKQMGGDIWVYNEPGMETTFEIFLPRTANPAKPQSDRQARPQGLRRRKTILLVENEDLVRMATRRILEGYGYRVVTASNARSAEAVSGRPDQIIDLLLADVVMQEISGPQLVERLLVQRPGLRVLYMAGCTESTLGSPIGTEGAQDIIHKPFSPEVLLRKARQLLHGDAG